MVDVQCFLFDVLCSKFILGWIYCFCYVIFKYLVGLELLGAGINISYKLIETGSGGGFSSL